MANKNEQAYADFVESMRISGVTDPAVIKEQAKTRGLEISTAAGNKPGDVTPNPDVVQKAPASTPAPAAPQAPTAPTTPTK